MERSFEWKQIDDDEEKVRRDIFDERGEYKRAWARLIRGRYLEKAKTTAVPWTKENVCNFIYRCRVLDNGIPVFKTHYGTTATGEPMYFVADGNYYVLAVCWLGKNTYYGRSQWFGPVPKEIVETLRIRKGDWKWLANEYCPEEIKRKIYEAPIIF